MKEIEIEIFESGCGRHKIGEKFKYPSDIGKMCPWLLDSANIMIRVLLHDGMLGWSYEGTPYEKIINKDGVTTEFIRCPDPTTAGVVLKITATKITSEK
ncbi:MAG: hypothetical protein E4H14_19970 [Candidatus Thorarchaeota archaeon]|nr:MAG: hypothetical protein E4H14_19970 [Candidatus Thorarchaeota archaeon]